MTERVFASNDRGVTVERLTDKRLSEALRVMRESYYPDEAVARGFRLQQDHPETIDELEQLTIETYKDGTSLVALYDGQVVGVSFNKVDSRYDVYTEYGVDSSLEVMFLVTSNKSRCLGVGTLLVSASEIVARERGIALCTAICSALGTEHICLRNLKWEKLLAVPKSEFPLYDYLSATSETSNLVLVAKGII
ncbi:hypothetical protein B566_EDAN015892 [Ephemera danica]|nr:hypothetical protein B566_EDAN015892 [Ephemera danica]